MTDTYICELEELTPGTATRVVLEGVPTALQSGVRVIQRMIELTPTPAPPQLPRPSRPSLSRSKEKADS